MFAFVLPWLSRLAGGPGPAASSQMVRPAEKIIGSFLVKDGGNMRRAALKEYSYMASSIADCWTPAKDAFIRGDSILSPHNTEWFTAGSPLTAL
jgi:hypothetical protein